MLGHPTYFEISTKDNGLLAVGAGGVVWIFCLLSITLLFSLSLSLSLWEMAQIYRNIV